MTVVRGQVRACARIAVPLAALAASLALTASPAMAATPPSIDGESAAPAVPTQGYGIPPGEETLSAQINPNGLDTTYHFEYGPADCSTSACTSVPSPDADIGSGTSDQTVTQTITGLQASTTYHYRVVATNSAGPPVDGPDQTFTTVPGFGFQPGSAGLDVSITNQDGSPDTQAGSHPYEVTVGFTLNSAVAANGELFPIGGDLKDFAVNLPPGLIGNPQATLQCTRQQLDGGSGSGDCPGASQIGVASVSLGGAGSSPFTLPTVPVYNMVPPPGVPAQFGFSPEGGLHVFLDAGVRTGGDYGITESVDNIGQPGVIASSVTLYGDPPDASEGLLTMPTSCGGPLTVTATASPWEDPSDVAQASAQTVDQSGNPVGITGCNQLDFSPSITVQPDTSVADSPSGLAVDLQMPLAGLEDPNGLAEANLDDATVTLPQGVSVNPSAANGLAACTPQEIGIDNASEPSCPDGSKIGTVQITTPLLTDQLMGGIYVAQQTQNPFGSLLAIYVTAEADGVLIKLAGHVVADSVTGQLTTTFSNNPQLPFTDFKLDFFGGPGGVLATPDQCGTYTTQSSLSSWSGFAPATSSSSFTISSGCVSGFAPSFTAGTQNAQAGSYSPFTLTFSRQDTDQNFSGLSVTLPPGMLAKLAGVQECSDADLATAAANTGTQEQANPSCPAGSQVGIVETGAGVGPDPFNLAGNVYLTGPYNGAPYGLAVVVPAVAGPYDLGTVVVRQALFVDPTTAQVTDVSDPFPTILQGIPLRIRSISVDLNRPDFTVNPTSCDPMAVTGTLTSTGGLSAPSSSRFQVGGCAALAFSPKLKMALKGNGKTRSGDHPTLTATLTQPGGQANIASTKVTLPLSMALDPNNSQHVCNYDVALAVHGGAVGCPASTIVGTATAITPLLSQPLTGKVYLVQGIRFNKQGQRIRTLPSLLVPLRGQIALDLRANTSVNAGSALVTTFSTIPDAAVSKFTLTITGGRKGLLVITGRGRTICNKTQVTGAAFSAQSGKTQNSSIKMSTPCRKVKATKHSKKHKKHGKR